MTGRNLFGATVNLNSTGSYGSCGGGPCNLCNAAAFDGIVSTGLANPIKPAETLQKVYFQYDDFSIPSGWNTFVASGGKIFVSFKPNKTISSANDTAFKNCLSTMVSRYGTANFKICLWQEMDAQSRSGFTPSQYITYAQHYYAQAKAVSSAVKVVYDPTSASTATSYYPGDAYVDEVCCDYYGSRYVQGGRLDFIAALADNHKPNPVPFGLGEWGNSASGTMITTSQWTSYTNYLATFFSGRVSSGLNNGWIMHFDSSGNGTLGTNGIVNSSDPQIPGFQHFFLSVASNGGTSSGHSGDLSITLRRPSVTLSGKSVRKGAFNIKLPKPRLSLAGGGTTTAPHKFAGTSISGPVASSGNAVLRAGSSTATTGGGATTLAATVPSGVQTGDLVLIYCAMGFASETFSAPGFTAIPAASGSSASGQLLYRKVDGTEGWTPGTSTITVTATAGHPWDLAIVAVGGAGSSLFDPVPSVSGSANAPSATVAAPAVTTADAGDLLIWFGFIDAPAGGTPQAITLPSGYTAAASQANSSGTSTENVGLAVGTATQAAAGSTGAVDGSVTTAQYNGAMVVAIPGAGAVTTAEPAFVQDVASGTGSSVSSLTLTLAAGISTTAGNTLVLAGRGNGGSHVTAVSDSRGNTWTVDSADTTTTTTSIAHAYLGTALAAGDTITVTFSASQSIGAMVAEFSGVAQGAADVVATAKFGGTAITVETAANTAQASELVICGVTSSVKTGSWSLTAADPDSGGAWTALNYPSATGEVNLAWQVASAESLFSCSWGYSSSENLDAAIVTYKAATSSSGSGSGSGANQVNVTTATSDGDTLVVVVGVGGASAPSCTGLSDSQGNSYELVNSQQNPALYVFEATGGTRALSPQDHLTVYLSGSGAGASLNVTGVAIPGAGSPDVVTSGSGSGTAPSVSGTPAHAGEVAVAAFAWANAGGSGTLASPFTQLDQEHTTGLAWLTTAYALDFASGSLLTASDTIASCNWNSALVTFQASGAAISGDFAITLPPLGLSLSGARAPAGRLKLQVPVPQVTLDDIGTVVSHVGSFNVILPRPVPVLSQNSPSAYLAGTFTTKNSGSASQQVTLTSAVSAGDFLALCSMNADVLTIVSVTDSAGNYWTPARRAKVSASGLTQEIWKAHGVPAMAAGDTITVTYSGTTTAEINLIVVGATGVPVFSPLDQAASASGTGTAPSATTVPTTQASELAIAFMTDQNAGGQISWGSGWTQLAGDVVTLANQISAAAYQVLSAEGAVTASGTLAASVNWDMSVITVAVAAAPVASLAFALPAPVVSLDGAVDHVGALELVL